MLLSHQPPFLFIHIDKAAGTSIQRALQPFAQPRANSRLHRRLVWLGKLNRVGKFYRALEFPEHAAARTVQNCLPPDVYSQLFKFAFVRNPWDRLVSRYSFLLRSENHPRHDFVKRMNGFEDYVKWEIARGMFQYKYVTDSGGKIIVDFIGYFERLNGDFAKVCTRLKIQAQLPQVNTSSHKDYRTCFTPSLCELVAKHFRRDIELFGYEFDGLSKGI